MVHGMSIPIPQRVVDEQGLLRDIRPRRRKQVRKLFERR
jgi:hypothetical protein